MVDPVAEAHRYVENAQQLLKEHGQLDHETQLYRDRKYLQMAGNTLWNGVLLILDAVFHVRTEKRFHPDIKDYREVIGKHDRKLLDLVNTAYETLHIILGYDGNRERNICNVGIRHANEIINRCEVMLRKAA